jgi:S-adenosylmethionine decarboxylase
MTTPNHTGFGPHLMLDCRQCNLQKMGDLAFIFDFLNRLPEQIGMTKITQPYVFPYEGLIPEDKGVTGTVIIAESHITFHSFLEKDYFFFDAFSCKPFDIEQVQQIVQDTFEVKLMQAHVKHRGLDFPRSTVPSLASSHQENFIQEGTSQKESNQDGTLGIISATTVNPVVVAAC